MIMFMNRTSNVQRLGNLKSLLKTTTIECVSLLTNKQQNRLSSSNDGDRVNDEKFDNQTTTATSTSDENDVKHTAIEQQLPEKNGKMFIEVNLFGPKDPRLPLAGSIGFAPEYLKKKGKKKISSKQQQQLQQQQQQKEQSIEKEFDLIKNHNPSSNESLTSTIEFNLNDYETNQDRQNRVIENAVYNQKDELSLERNQSKFKNLFFVKVYTSTQFLLNDIKQIFPKDCLFEKDFVIITVYRNPFAKLTDVNLKKEFAELASSITDSLNKVGCWTNYLEPDSKRYFLCSIKI